MKDFLESKRVTYNLMSFTGFKSILLFSYLLEQPRSYEEVKEYFNQHEYLHETISMDTLRVYIKSLERLGCVIIRDKTPEGVKYKIVKHPFELNIDDEQIRNLTKIYRSLIKSIEIEDLLALTKFFDKLAYSVKNEELQKTLLNLSPLKKVDTEILKALILACRKKDEITITYNSPSSGKKEIDVLTEKLVLTNNKLYLHGLSPKYKGTATFLVSRIVKKPIIKLQKQIQDIKPTPIIIGCEIYDKEMPLLENEKIISEDENKLVIEIASTNQFHTRQRILSMGSRCKVLYPQSLIDDLCSILKKIKEEYVAEEI